MIVSYAKAAAALVPGAGRLPFVAGGGGDVPTKSLTRTGVGIDRGRLARYALVCGFDTGEVLPPTYPHILAFPLHMELMTSGAFPFPAVGLVHVRNRIEVERPIAIGERLDLDVHATPVEPHPKGCTFTLVTTATVDGQTAWREESTMLRRGRGAGDREQAADVIPPPVTTEWSLPADLGRRYASVSGDRNPIHLHPLSARVFGFPGSIAHGMWTKARALAELQPELPDSYAVEVDFKRPILLPATVGFGHDSGDIIVRTEEAVHLLGRVVLSG